MDIRKVIPEEVAALQQISRETFLETFSAFNSEENMQQYLSTRFATEKLTTELEQSQFFFAVHEEKIIGYLKLNTAEFQTEFQDGKALEIERIYVLKDFHGLKVGQALYEQALTSAKEMNAPYIWLGVWEKNMRALSFYKKNGFIEFDKHIFKLGNDEQTDIMMKKNM
jgi:ribosomal protein S18 acetylase RimI-like enzyme